MSAPRRKRAPRKTPPGRKPLPRKITDEADLLERADFIARREALEQAAGEIQQALIELEGERKHWRRTVIDPKYAMNPEDIIDADGTIVRSQNATN